MVALCSNLAFYNVISARQTEGGADCSILLNSLLSDYVYFYYSALFILPASLDEVEDGAQVSPSPSVRLFMDRIVPTLYLPRYLPGLFLIYTSYQPTSEGVSHVVLFFNFKILIFALF